MLTEDDLVQQAAVSGFSAETLEKVLRLLALLEGIFRHPFLGPRVALKGGTALNLFIFDLPRLSVDIDLNYIGAIERKAMRADVPKVQQAIRAVCGRENIVVKRVPKDHAGGKWRLGTTRVGGGTGSLELDVNFMLRTPLWPTKHQASSPILSRRVDGVRILDDHELAAGKLAALMARSASRDIFDARGLLARGDLDREKLRLGFVVYGGISRRDWRTLALDDITADPQDVTRDLVPMLRADVAPPKAEIASWTKALVRECRELMSDLLPLADSEREFLDQLNDHGVIRPELLTTERALQQRIGDHPGLAWKALNVREHRGIDG